MFLMGAILAFMHMTFDEKPCDLWYSLIVTFQAVSGLCSTLNPKRSIMRFHFAMSLVTSLWMNQIFSCFLISFAQTILYENQISTHNELAEKNFRLAGDVCTFDYLKSINAVSELISNVYFKHK